MVGSGVYLLRGLLWSFAGGALIICLLGIAISTHRPESEETIMYRAKGLAQGLNISTEEAKQIVRDWVLYTLDESRPRRSPTTRP